MQRLLKYTKENRDFLINITAGLLVFFIPISSALTNIMLIPLTVLVAYDRYKQKSIPFFSTLPTIFFSLSIFSLFIIAIFKGSFILDAGIYIRYFTVLLLFILYDRVSKIETVEKFYLLGLSIVTVIAIVKIINFKTANPDLLFNTGDSIDEILWGSRPYASFMLVLGIFISLRRFSLNSKKSWFFLIPSVIFLLLCNYISARLSLALGVATAVYFLFFRFKMSNKVKVLSMLVFVVLVMVMVIFNKSLILRTPLDNLSKLDKIVAIAKDREPRYVIWSCSSILLKTNSNALFGISSYERYRQDLVNCYAEIIINREEKQKYYMDSRFGSHNQFLDFWLNGGILPFLLLLASFASAFFSKKINSNAKWIYFLFFSFFLVENVLYRQTGYYLFGIFATLYTCTIYKKGINEKSHYP